jgi:hypothetical protein
MKYFFPKIDSKMLLWTQGRNDVFRNKKSIFYFYWCVAKAVFRFRISNGSLPVVFFRYLNVYRSIFIELFLLALDYVLFMFAYLGWLEIRWIAHNLDAETINRYPGISRLRRRTLVRIASKVFVTDKILLDEARRRLRNDVIPISFGEVRLNEKSDEVVLKAVSLLRAKGFNHIGVAANWVDKTSGVEDILKNISLKRPDLGVVYLCDNTTIVADNIFVIATKQVFIMNDFNFCVKSLADVSIPYSLYHAMSAVIPIVHNGRDAFTQLFKEYDVGRTVEDVIRNEICIDDCYRFFEFRNWSASSKKLLS